ncbi:hypothetical protein LSS_19790 [Leptospira santarosai serovar Shermani str. LT 821]|uniref:Uncharacterized protein n=1 Tax=Leptospira santarosai serovar Shermani str. LT 821 TaxID=758847 RepID=K8XTP7_9LEPT|nr:hypothetical protein LSS_19790 [Leptospira santarosai serovar Shermani str. LT 821]
MGFSFKKIPVRFRLLKLKTILRIENFQNTKNQTIIP